MGNTNPAIPGCGFHHLSIKARDFDASYNFYTEVLGFRPGVRWGEGDGRAVMLDMGDGACLELFAGGDGSKGEGILSHLALGVEDVDAAVERVRSAGMTITMEPKTVAVPSQPVREFRIAFFDGPDGERVEFFRDVTG